MNNERSDNESYVRREIMWYLNRFHPTTEEQARQQQVEALVSFVVSNPIEGEREMFESLKALIRPGRVEGSPDQR